MNNWVFVTDIEKERFNEPAFNENVKSHFLGSYEWGELSAQNNWTPMYVGVEEDGRLIATALLLRKMLLKGYNYVYIPRGYTADYSNRELLKFMTENIVRMLRKQKTVFFEIDPDIKLHTLDIEGNVVEGEENSELVEFLKGLGFRHKPLTYLFEGRQPRFTFRIPLDGEMEDIEARYNRTTRTRIKKSLANEVEVYKGSAEDIDEFIRLMKMTEARQDFFSHEYEYYRRLYDTLHPSDMVDLYLGRIDVEALRAKVRGELEQEKADFAKYENSDSKSAEKKRKEIEKRITACEGRLAELDSKNETKPIVSAYIITKYDDKAWALFAANDMDYSKFFANYAVYRQQLRDTHADGRRIFDVFGTVGDTESAGNAAGLYEFKKKWGGEFTEFIGEFVYVLDPLMYFVYEKLIPIRHKIINRSLRKKVKESAE